MSSNTLSYFQQFFEFSSSPISVVLTSLIGLLILLLVIAMFSDKVKRFLVSIYALDEEETPKSFLTWILMVIIVVRVFQVFILQPFIVDGLSMYPTFNNNNMLIIDKFSYKIGEPSRGDVVVFKFHQNGSTLDGKYFLKRLIALPGDTIIIDGRKTTIKTADGKTITPTENFVKLPKLNQKLRVTLKEDEYFVMGDNRDGSYDSRSWGPIHKSQLAGRVLLEIYDNFSFLPGKVADYK